MASRSQSQAFLEASSGATGAVFSTMALYPLDVAKTKKQAHVKQESGGKHPLEKGLFDVCSHILQTQGYPGLFVGFKMKALHTFISNFAYFYWYSLLKRMAQQKGRSLTTTANLAVASVAGAINMSLTLPMELITTQQQTYTATQSRKQRSMMTLIQEIMQERGVLGFWRGYLASLLLVCNPAINYTIFDTLKLKLQHLRMVQRNKSRLSSLTMFEAFVLAAIAKSVATIITYPLIRAKIIMQSQSKPSDKENGKGTASSGGGNLLETLEGIARADGLAGYYKGCSAQLFNTVLKSALLLMTKEQIAKYTKRVLYGLRSRE